MKNVLDNITQTYSGLTHLQRILVLIIIAVVSFSLSTSLSFSVFSKSGLPSPLGKDGAPSLPGPSTAFEEDPNEPRTEVCPLDGDKHTKKAKENWEKRRPL